MNRQINLNISLTPVSEYDAKAERYIMYFKDFPQAIASGVSEDEAENNLIFLVEDMWKKRKDDLRNFLLKNYGEQIRIQSSVKC